MMLRAFAYLASLTLLMCACGPNEVSIQSGNLLIEFDSKLHSMVSSIDHKALVADFAPSEYLICKNFSATDFELQNVTTVDCHDSVGTGKRFIIKGNFLKDDNISIQKILDIKVYEQFPGQAFYKVSYINTSHQNLPIEKWVNHDYRIIPQQDTIPFWSFQGESTGARRDWILPLRPGFYQRNYMGMNNSDYGGGIPVTDVWRSDQGFAVGHAETIPQLVALPVDVDENEKTAHIDLESVFIHPVSLKPGDTLHIIESFVSVHDGDYYRTLKRYGEVLQAKGVKLAPPEDGAYESSWCAWGYMRDFTEQEILGTLAKVKSLGIKWVTIDDGYQQAEGDWHVSKKKFPGGDKQMRALVDKIHAQGFKVMLWWTPLAADPGSTVLTKNPDLELITADGAPQYITWWDAYYLSPAYPKTVDYTKETLSLFFRDYNVDGIKMDGQHMNAVAPDYNPEHNLAYPEKSVEALPAFFKMIYDESNKLKPHALIQNCPCGTCMSVFNMPYMNQSVASDPVSSWQVRSKGKTYKALLGKRAYFGDHVELSDGRRDFASSFGVGAVLGTKFTWPKENPTVKEDNLLTPEKEVVWRKWFGLYDAKMLSKEVYRGELYDIGYDLPETHVIQKGDTLHYAFYAKSWDGAITLRGLTAKRYKVRDYVNNVDLGEVDFDKPVLNFKFDKDLLIEVFPVK